MLSISYFSVFKQILLNIYRSNEYRYNEYKYSGIYANKFINRKINIIVTWLVMTVICINSYC